MEDKIKYPRTYHFPWSDGRGADDKVLDNDNHFNHRKISISEKMDGECSTLTNKYIWARSVDSQDHYSRHWLKGRWAEIKNEIPSGWRICGENLKFTKSIYYEDLEDFFLVFSIWNENNMCLSIPDTLEWCELLELKTVPILYNGMYDWSSGQFKKAINSTIKKQAEGYVIRLYDSFNYENFDTSVAKWVRKDHVQTNIHWMHLQLKPNKLRKEEE